MLLGTSGGECYGTYDTTSKTGSGAGYVNNCIHSRLNDLAICYNQKIVGNRAFQLFFILVSFRWDFSLEKKSPN